jgi:hypothetical protein
MKGFVTHPAIATVLRRLGIDHIQYSVLLDLFAKLSNRQEFEAGSARWSLRIMVGMFAVFSGLINLIVAFGPKPPVRSYVLGNFIFTTFLLVMILTMEAINTFLNPVEASALAHQPIREGTYFAAKLTYLGIVVGYVVFPINILPALAALNLKDASWLHPVTYLISVYLLGFFIALLGCGALGLLFRVLHPARVRNAVLSLQIGFFVLLGIGPRVLAAFRGVGENVNVANSTAFPLNWFVALASPTSVGIRAFVTWPAIFSMIGCGVFIAFGVQSLSEGYLSRVHHLLRSGPSRRRTYNGFIGTALRMLTGNPSGRAAFAFVYAMARTDWQFRRMVYPMLIQLTILPVLGMARAGLGHSPFQPGPPTASHFLPHLGGLMGLMFCFAITYSNQHRAAWIFLTFPMDSIRAFVRGLFWALWIPLSTVPVLLLPLFIWRWGIADAVLFTSYCLAVGSFYLSIEMFLIDGLPFSNPPEAMKGTMAAPLVILGIAGALILVGLQWLFIFQSKFVTAGAILVFAGTAYLLANTSLRYLEVNVLHSLHVIATGRTAMFKEVG